MDYNNEKNEDREIKHSVWSSDSGVIHSLIFMVVAIVIMFLMSKFIG